jgi:hypothetical protein
VILGELKQVPAVEGRSRMRGDIDRAHRRPARKIEGARFVSGRKPHVPTVKRYPMHVVDTREGSVLMGGFRPLSGSCFHPSQRVAERGVARSS